MPRKNKCELNSAKIQLLVPYNSYLESVIAGPLGTISRFTHQNPS